MWHGLPAPLYQPCVLFHRCKACRRPPGPADSSAAPPFHSYLRPGTNANHYTAVCVVHHIPTALACNAQGEELASTAEHFSGPAVRVSVLNMMELWHNARRQPKPPTEHKAPGAGCHPRPREAGVNSPSRDPPHPPLPFLPSHPAASPPCMRSKTQPLQPSCCSRPPAHSATPCSPPSPSLTHHTRPPARTPSA